jgi:ABC-2 type transport system ATP-binding protein
MTPVAELVNVSKRYGRHVALDAVSFSVTGREILGVIGPNGAGKTTLLRLLVGLIRPTAGTIRLNVTGTTEAARYFAGEHTLPPNVSARQWLSLWSASTVGEPRQRLNALSRGTRQAIGLKAVLASPDAPLLVLDEPWESLDPDASRWLSHELVRKSQSGVAVVVSSHRIHDLASVCTRCEFLVAGRIAPTRVVLDESLGRDERAARLFEGFDRARATP